jgi:hypothetical protein
MMVEVPELLIAMLLKRKKKMYSILLERIRKWWDAPAI